MAERVLVLPRGRVPGSCDFRGVRPTAPEDFEALRQAVASNGAFVERSAAEEDASHKQLIPYVVVRDARKVFLTERTTAGGDARLHGMASIGVGGHLNPVDHGEDPLTDGLRREWAEELVVDWEPEFRLVGLINDDSNPVGAVHLGVVFTVDAAGRPVAVREHDKLVGRWVSEDELRTVWRRLETWSQLVSTHLFGA